MRKKKKDKKGKELKRYGPLCDKGENMRGFWEKFIEIVERELVERDHEERAAWRKLRREGPWFFNQAA